MDNVAAWITPLLLLPGVALLIMSTTIRYGRIHDEFHHLLTQPGSENATLQNLIKRSLLFRDALVSLYAGFAFFSLGSLIGGLTEKWMDFSDIILMITTCLGILCIVFASLKLLRESILSWHIFRDHAKTAGTQQHSLV